MNWNGGALARANLKRQSNYNRTNHYNICNRRNVLNDNDNGRIINDGCPVEHGAQGFQLGTSSITAIPVAKRSRQSSSTNQEGQEVNGRMMNHEHDHHEYSVLGYDLDKPEKYERRVVPLLEFLEKKFPQGHVLSLQLSHQMDITRNTSESGSRN